MDRRIVYGGTDDRDLLQLAKDTGLTVKEVFNRLWLAGIYTLPLPTHTLPPSVYEDAKKYLQGQRST